MTITHDQKLLTDAIERHGYDESFIAYLHAAIGEKLDAAKVVEVAEEAMKRRPNIADAEPQEDDADVLFAGGKDVAESREDKLERYLAILEGREVREAFDESKIKRDKKGEFSSKTTKGANKKEDEPEEGFSLAGLQKHIGANAIDPDPKKTKDFDLAPYKEIVSAIIKDVEDHAATRSFKSLTISDFVNKFPSVSVSVIHKILGKLHHDGLIKLGPFTQALATHEKPEHLLPLEREAKYFVRQGVKRQIA